MFNIDNIHPSWKDFFTKEIIEELDKIENKIGSNYFPKKENVLRFTNLDLNEIKYIIVGMEPYPSSYEKNGIVYPIATGRSFEIDNIYSWSQKFKQSSLRNIIKTIYFNYNNKKINLETLREKIASKEFNIKSPKEWYDSLEKQGVMFLNATLTVEPYNVDSHTKIWETFMNKLIKYINNNNKNILFLLWGNKAQERVLPLIDTKNAICNQHPRLVGFIDENCFEKLDKVNWLG